MRSNPLWSNQAATSRRRVLAGLAAGVAMLRDGSDARAAPPGSLCLYSSIEPGQQHRVTDAFTARTGIGVRVLRMSSSPLGERLLAEQQAGNDVCDVISTGNDEVLKAARRLGALADLSSLQGLEAISGPWRPASDYFISSSQALTLAHHVGQAIRLAGWHDVLNPAFKHRLAILDPRFDDVIGRFWLGMRRLYGDDFLRAVAAQKPLLVSSAMEGSQKLASGDVAILMPCLPASIMPLMRKGAPVALIAAPSPSLVLANYTAIMAHAPNHAAATAYVDFLATPEGQDILCGGIFMSPLGHIQGAAASPAKLIDVSEADAQSARDAIFDLLDLPA